MKPIHHAVNKPEAEKQILQILLDAGDKCNVFGDQKVVPLAQSLDYRNRTPLLTSIRAGAPDDVVEVLTRPKYFDLKKFDDFSIEVLGRKVNENDEMKLHVIELLSRRSYFTILFLEFYAHAFAIIAFIEASERMLNPDKELTYFLPSVIGVCVLIFIIREMAQMKSQGWQYITDVWNIPEYLSIIFLAMSIVHMVDFIEFTPQEFFEIRRNRLILTGIFLIVTFIFYLRSTFLPFARFVGGLLLILTNLIPFFTVTALLLLAFTVAFRISDDRESCDAGNGVNLSGCYYWTLQQFFSGSDETNGFLDVLFGVVAIVILLNVVIAIVGDAWELATGYASNMYWTFRVNFLREAKTFSDIQSLWMNYGLCHKLSTLIDSFPDLRFRDDVDWNKGVFKGVTNRDRYCHPYKYFLKPDADKIAMSRSIEADIYWVKHQRGNRKVPSDAFLMVRVVLQNVWNLVIYLILIILGLVTGGWFWPVKFRQRVLSLGLKVGKEENTT